jgi:hypothetical protein
MMLMKCDLGEGFACITVETNASYARIGIEIHGPGARQIVDAFEVPLSDLLTLRNFCDIAEAHIKNRNLEETC